MAFDHDASADARREESDREREPSGGNYPFLSISLAAAITATSIMIIRPTNEGAHKREGME